MTFPISIAYPAKLEFTLVTGYMVATFGFMDRNFALWATLSILFDPLGIC